MIDLLDVLGRNLRSDLLQTVGKRLWLIGSLLPRGRHLAPERVLADGFGVERGTLRKSIKALTDEGFLQSVRGRYGGTFVPDTANQYPPPWLSSVGSVEESLDEFKSLLDVVAISAASTPLSANLRSQLIELASVDISKESRLVSQDLGFQLTVTSACRSPRFIALIAEARVDLFAHWRIGDPEVLRAANLTMAESILRGNAVEALIASTRYFDNLVHASSA